MLEIENLTKALGHRTILNNLSLSIQPGEIYSLLGPNGAGKTTTVNIVCGLLKADSGHVRIQGKPPSPATRTLLGVVPQENLLYRSLTCQEHLNFFGQLYGLTPQQRRDRSADCLAAVHLTPYANRPAEALSGGLKRRLSLAIALIHHPKLLILDEPTTGLDIEARQRLWELIRQLQNQGMTILLTTHLLDEAERMSQRIGILKDGQLLAEGTLSELRQRISAQEIIQIQTPDPDAAIACATALGYETRQYGGELACWLPTPLTLTAILEQFQGIPLDGVSRQPVRLEHIYLEVTQSLAPSPNPPSDQQLSIDSGPFHTN